MQNSNSKNYPLNVWLTTITIAPLLQILFIIFYHSTADIFETFQAYLFLIVLSAIISIPSLVIYYLIYKALRLISVADILTKLILSILAIALFLVTKAILDSIIKSAFYHPKNIAFIINYSTCILITGFYFKLPAKNVLMKISHSNYSDKSL